jgi:hypothetical protein
MEWKRQFASWRDSRGASAPSDAACRDLWTPLRSCFVGDNQDTWDVGAFASGCTENCKEYE